MVTQHIVFGQINLFLMALVLADLLRRDDTRFARFFPRGIFVGIAAAIKLTPALFIVYFVATKQWRLALWSAIGALGATVVAALLLPAVSWHFWSEIFWQLRSRVRLSEGAFASYANNSLQGILAALGPWTEVLVLPLSVLAAVAAVAIARRVYLRGCAVDAALIIGLAAPIVSPVSWIHHWVYLIPAGVTLLMRPHGWRSTVAIWTAFVFLLLGPWLGDAMLHNAPVLAPLGILERESLFVASLAAIGALYLSSRVPRESTAIAPVSVSL